MRNFIWHVARFTIIITLFASAILVAVGFHLLDSCTFFGVMCLAAGGSGLFSLTRAAFNLLGSAYKN